MIILNSSWCGLSLDVIYPDNETSSRKQLSSENTMNSTAHFWTTFKLLKHAFMKTTQGQIFLLSVLKCFPLNLLLQVQVLAFCGLTSFKMECDEHLTMFCLDQKYSEHQFDQSLSNGLTVSSVLQIRLPAFFRNLLFL